MNQNDELEPINSPAAPTQEPSESSASNREDLVVAGLSLAVLALIAYNVAADNEHLRPELRATLFVLSGLAATLGGMAFGQAARKA